MSMNLLAIKDIFKVNNEIKYYTFKKIEHEVVLLKKLEDNKIFYNNTIYDQNFFYYHKLAGFMEQIYELRDQYIIDNLDMHFREFMGLDSKKPSLKKRIKRRIKYTLRSIKAILYWKKKTKFGSYHNMGLINFINYDPTNCDEITGLVKEQYDILVTAYKYEFDYPLGFDLLNPKLEIEKSSKLMKEFFYDWFYILGWKCIKPVQLTFAEPFEWKHYEDERSKNMNLSYLNRTVLPDPLQDVIFRNRYDNPFDVGTRFKLEWVEDKYDEQKKFEEFDINCKTNSYYTRYIAYNEIYNKDYPEEKKFKTDLIHDFTEEEIKENYENMINKDNKLALDKFNFIMFNEKRKKLVFDFFTELETIEVNKEALIYENAHCYWLNEEDSHMDLNKEVENIILEKLNDPRNLLLMPLLDSYFQIFRRAGYYEDEKDTTLSAPPFHDTGCHKKLMKHLKYFELSYERQYFYAEKDWIIDDYMEIEDLDRDEYYEWEFNGYVITLVCVIGMFFFNWYVVFAWFIQNDFAYTNDYFGNISKFYELLEASVYDKSKSKENFYGYRQYFCPEIYYGLELKRPRARIKTNRIILPYKFYEPSYYSYTKKRATMKLPMTILDSLCESLDEEDYGLNDLNYRLEMYGKTHLFWQLRIFWVEPDYPWTDEIPSPLTRLTRFFSRINRYLEDKLETGRRSQEFWNAYWIFYDKYLKEYWEPVMAFYREVNKAYIGLQKLIKNYLIEAKNFIIDFFKKPTN